MTQWLDSIRIDSLEHGAGFGMIVQHTTNGEATKFRRGESAETTVRTLRDLADRIERHACEDPIPCICPLNGVSSRCPRHGEVRHLPTREEHGS